MRQQGPYAFANPGALMTFRLFREFGVALDILLRRKSFFAESAWTCEPWWQQGDKNMVDYAVDLLAQIPGMIESVDSILAGRQAAEDLQANTAYLIGVLRDWRTLHLGPYVLQKHGRSIDIDTLVRSIADRTLVDAFLAQALVLHLTTWLLLTRLGPEGSLPWPAKAIFDNILDICEENY